MVNIYSEIVFAAHLSSFTATTECKRNYLRSHTGMYLIIDEQTRMLACEHVRGCSRVGWLIARRVCLCADAVGILCEWTHKQTFMSLCKNELDQT